MKQKKLLAIILGIAIFAGILCSGIIIVTGIQNGAASPRKEKYPQPHTLEKTKIGEFSEASINLDYANISILPSDGFYLEYRLDGTCKEPDYDVSNGKFYFREGSVQERYQISFGFFGKPYSQEPFYLNLYVPKNQYFELLTLSLESGNAELEQLDVKKADFSLSYGNLNLGDFTGNSLAILTDSGNIESNTITCDNLSISSSYGSITGDTISVSNKADLRLDSGNLELSQMTADTLSFNNSYGNCIIGTIAIRTGKFSLDSGNLELENTTLENTDIDSEYGDVTLKLSDNPSGYNYDLETEYGTIKIDGKNIKENDDGMVIYQKQNSQETKNIQIRCESGNINIR